MALISAKTIITSICLFHLTLGFFFLTNPATLADQGIVYLLGEAMGLPYARSFEAQSPAVAFLGVILASIGLCDLLTHSLPDDFSDHYWAMQGTPPNRPPPQHPPKLTCAVSSPPPPDNLPLPRALHLHLLPLVPAVHARVDAGRRRRGGAAAAPVGARAPAGGVRGVGVGRRGAQEPRIFRVCLCRDV